MVQIFGWVRFFLNADPDRGIFRPRLLGASLNYAFFGGSDGLFLGRCGLIFSNGSGSGQAPIAGVRIRADFFIFLDLGSGG